MEHGIGSNPISSLRRKTMFDYEDYVPQSKNKFDEYVIETKLDEDIIECDEEEEEKEEEAL